MKILAKRFVFVLVALLMSAVSVADPDIIVVGAGPVGLATAVEIALYTKGSDVKILLVEKHERYQRTNSITLKEESFVKAHSDESFRKMWQGWGNTVAVTRVENDLLRLATELGVEIQRPLTIENPSQIRERYPNTRVVIAADGSHSALRQHFVSEAETHRKDLQYIVRVTYRVLSKTRLLKLWTEAAPLLSHVNHVVSESLRLNADGSTQVTLDAIVSEKEYKAVKKNATFKKPIRWHIEEEKGLVPGNLMKTIEKWMQQRGVLLQEEAIEGTVEMSCTELVTYASPRVVFEEEGVEYFLVGDAAFGVPYFRSGNNGFMCANVLSKVIARKFVTKLNRGKGALLAITTPLGALSFVVQNVVAANTNEDYQSFVLALQSREVLFAHLKRLGLWALQTPVQTVQMLSRSAVSPRPDPVKIWEEGLQSELEPAGMVEPIANSDVALLEEEDEHSGSEDASVKAVLFESSAN